MENTIKKIFSLDLRSLALFRIGFACILLFNQISRFTVLDVFFTDQGALPRSLFAQLIPFPWSHSFYMLSGSYSVQLAILLIEMLVTICFLVGYQTRLANLLVWVFLCSSQIRNPMMIHFGDDFLRVMLFWSVFIPTNAFFSIDSLSKNKTEAYPADYYSLASVGFILQIVYMYVFTGIIKWNPVWYKTGNALYYALANDHLVTWFGAWLRHQPQSLLQTLTIMTLWFELIAPLLLFIPYKNKKFRFFIPILFIFFHLTLELSLYVGIFAQVCIFSWIGMLNEEFWNKASWIKNKLNSVFEKIKLVRFSATPRLKLNFAEQAIVAVALLLVTTFNVTQLPPKRTLPEELQPIAYFTQLKQFWSMFAPHPIDWDGWFETTAITENNSSYILATKGSLPKSSISYIRWLKFLENTNSYNTESGNPILQNLTYWQCRNLNQSLSNGEKIKNIHYTFYFQKTPEPEAPPIPIEKKDVGTFNCQQ